MHRTLWEQKQKGANGDKSVHAALSAERINVSE